MRKRSKKKADRKREHGRGTERECKRFLKSFYKHYRIQIDIAIIALPISSIKYHQQLHFC